MFETLFSYPLLPFFVFMARICDVTLGTLRIIFISKGKKVLAPIFGFIEVFIWITVIGQILKHSDGDIVCYIAYAAGYATGSFVGMLVEERLALGLHLIRVFTKKNGEELTRSLNMHKFGATTTTGKGVEKDDQKAMQWYNGAAKQGVVGGDHHPITLIAHFADVGLGKHDAGVVLRGLVKTLVHPLNDHVVVENIGHGIRSLGGHVAGLL